MIKTLVLWACLLAAIACGEDGASVGAGDAPSDGGALVQAVASDPVEAPDAAPNAPSTPLEPPSHAASWVGLTRGQSNDVGHGAYVGTWPDYPSVRYWVAGAPTPFAPNPVDLGPTLGGTNTHGPELGIGRAAALAGVRVAICKAAHDSYTIDQLMTGVEWEKALACINVLKPLASEYHYPWVQGEADTAAPAGYKRKLLAMFAKVRAAFGTPRVRFEIVLLNAVNETWKGGINKAAAISIRADERAAVAEDPNATIVDVDDQVPYLGSGLHYDSAEELTIGTRIFSQRGAP